VEMSTLACRNFKSNQQVKQKQKPLENSGLGAFTQ